MEAIQQKIHTSVTGYISLLQEIVSDFAVVFTDMYTYCTAYLPKTDTLPTFVQAYILLLNEIYAEIQHAMRTDTIPNFFIPAVAMLLLGSSSFFFVTLIYFTG